MTTLADFSFVINNALGTVHVNAVGATVSTSALATNINYVQFDGATGVGQIMYNDRPSIAEQFTDPSPYQTYINSWISAEAALLTLPLTLAQAKAVKCALASAIWGVKRQQPVNVTVTAGNYNWDASDLGVSRLSAIAPYIYIGPVNTLIGTINSEMATLISALNTNVGDYNGFVTAYGSFVTNLQTNLNTWVAHLNTSEAAVTNWVQPGNMTVPASGSPSNMGNTSFSALSTITPPTMNLLPVGATSNVSLSPADLGSILQAIATQNAREALANATIQAAVNALSTISAVVAYDVTTGW
ncbi:hypothetical protein [Bradyrhizobium sp. Tv2a-2]|uniref:hypothetical protein n=1 Tax=Bradyrhizobium sp. Tv2a-2 TaxID=113395 RepID=UPI000416E4A1|nr:hypothetical protein [Bradyrhizobium sp. Tv2a-2]